MIYEFLADGFEIMEAMAPIDVLTRAKFDVKTVGIGNKQVKSSCGIPVICDIVDTDFDFENVEAIILPGGMPGTLNLEASKVVQDAIDFANEKNILICAICAAPSILGHKNLLNGKNAIAFPGFEEELIGANISKDFVVNDSNIITAKGAGVAIDFALEIVKYLKNEELSNSIKKTMQCK